MGFSYIPYNYKGGYKKEVIIIKEKNKGNPPLTVLNEIKYLRDMKDYLIDTRNRNRYRVLVKEKTGYTAYHFSTPIYNISTHGLVKLEFNKTKNGYVYKGSNGLISICENRCVFETHGRRVIIILKNKPIIDGKGQLEDSDMLVTPTLNGIRFCVKGNCISFTLKSEIEQYGIRSNFGCFAVMTEKFKPFLSVSSLFANDEKGNCFPVKINYKETGNQEYELEVKNTQKNGTFFFEMNLYEPKLFQDTTVNSFQPDMNNAYGAIGFIGETKEFGEQWLYLRPDFSKISDLFSEYIDRVLLHIPNLSGGTENLDVFVPTKRFCSFGSTWNKKVSISDRKNSSENKDKYLTIDLTSIFTDPNDQILKYNEGVVLKKPKGKNKFLAIATGDCYFAPQILEIKYK